MLGAMAPKTEYVSAQYVTLQGQQQTLSFPRGAELGGVVSYTHTHTHKDSEKTGRDSERERERREREWEAKIDRWDAEGAVLGFLQVLSICGGGPDRR